MSSEANSGEFGNRTGHEQRVWNNPSKLAGHILAQKGQPLFVSDDDTFIRSSYAWNDSKTPAHSYFLQSAASSERAEARYWLAITTGGDDFSVFRYTFNKTAGGVTQIENITDSVRTEPTIPKPAERFEATALVLRGLQTAPLDTLGTARSNENASPVNKAAESERQIYSSILTALETDGILNFIDANRSAIEKNPFRINKLLQSFVSRHFVYSDHIVRKAISARDELRGTDDND